MSSSYFATRFRPYQLSLSFYATIVLISALITNESDMLELVSGC